MGYICGLSLYMRDICFRHNIAKPLRPFAHTSRCRENLDNLRTKTHRRYFNPRRFPCLSNWFIILPYAPYIGINLCLNYFGLDVVSGYTSQSIPIFILAKNKNFKLFDVMQSQQSYTTSQLDTLEQGWQATKKAFDGTGKKFVYIRHTSVNDEWNNTCLTVITDSDRRSYNYNNLSYADKVKVVNDLCTKNGTYTMFMLGAIDRHDYATHGLPELRVTDSELSFHGD